MSVVDRLAAIADLRSGRGVHILRRGREFDSLTFAELYQEAGRVAAGLLDRGVMLDERVAVVLPTSIDFAAGFFGVLAAGGVSVPLPGPTPFASADSYLRRTVGALKRSQVRHLITDRSTSGVLTPYLAENSVSVDMIDMDTVRQTETAFVGRTDSDPAVVQYTSGTSADPRGVLLTHGNVVAGAAAIVRGTGLSAVDIGCNWLPLYHDMGLFGTFVTPALHDVDIYLQAPEEFLRNPFDWLNTVSRLGATVTAAPDSGYLYILRHVTSEQVGQLDLSRWRVAINGAEPIDPDTQRKFVSRFAAAGLAQNVFLPAYGLAEATLAVTFPPVGRATRTIKVRRDALGRGLCETITAEQEPYRELVSVGHPAHEVDVRIVGHDSVALGPNTVGDIEIRGAPVTPGYDRHPSATEAVRRRGGWVATGDLGVWHRDELYVVGRTKELVIILGVNHYASDIEATLHRIPDLPVRGILAQQIQTEDGGALGLVVESDEDDEDAKLAMTRRIREALLAELGIAPDRISYVAKGKIPRTSSGKPLRSNDQ